MTDDTASATDSSRTELDIFAARETNRALLSRESVAEALMLLHENGLPLHPDTPKNWDTFLALYPRGALNGH